MSTTTTDLSWDDLGATIAAAGGGVFLATSGADHRPHEAWVVPGWADERLWISPFASSQKAANLRHNPAVAMTCAATPETNVLIRATARLVDDPAEQAELWSGGVLPYDPAAFFSGPEDPEALFVELRPTTASVHSLDGSAARRWRPA